MTALYFTCSATIIQKHIHIPTQSNKSKNVGYQNKALNGGANSFVCGTFLPIGVDMDKVTLKDFVPADGAKGWNYGTDFIATLKTNGNLDKKYGYLSPYWANLYFDVSQVGWWDYAPLADEEIDDAESRNGVSIPFGTGVLAFTSGANVTITFAGEVYGDDAALALNGGANTFVGNASPADLTLGDLSATDGAKGWNYGTDFLATLKTNGNLEKKYGYLSPYWANLYFDASQVGWWDYALLADEEIDGAEKRDDIVIPAGQAFLVYTSNADVEFIIPSAL